MSKFETLKAAVLGAVVVGILLVAVGTQNGSGVVAEATAAAQPAEVAPYGYFPATFAAPNAPVEPHIEAF